VLFFAAALVSAWFTPTFNFYISLWQTAFGWSAIEAALHVLPVGVACMLLAFSGGLAKWADPKWLIIGGQLGALVGLVLFQYGGTKQAYWPYVFPGLVIGSAGDMMCYILAKYASIREHRFHAADPGLPASPCSGPRRRPLQAPSGPSSTQASNWALRLATLSRAPSRPLLTDVAVRTCMPAAGQASGCSSACLWSRSSRSPS
jgi:hypothetical protein